MGTGFILEVTKMFSSSISVAIVPQSCEQTKKKTPNTELYTLNG